MIKKPKPSLFRKFRQAMSFQTHLSKYLSYMKQTKDDRIKRLINDHSHIKDQFIKQQKNKLSLSTFLGIRVFSPVETGILIWFIFIFCAILYYYVEMGLVLTYGQKVWEDELTQPAFIALDVITIIIFFIDILVNLNCGFLYRGMIILDEKRVTARYLAYGFFLDIIALIIVIICPATGVFTLNYLKFWLLFKLIRLSEIDDFYLRRFNINRVGKALYVIFKMIVIIFLLSHLVGLIFYAMDYYYLTSGIYPPSFCWLISSTAFSPIIELDYSLQYLYTLYWGVNTITTISYGDIAPLNPPETNYSMICFCFGFMVYGYVVNQIVRIILWAREREDEFNSEMILIQTYMNKMGVSKNLKEQVCQYLSFLHNEEKDRDIQLETQMRKKIPQHLRIQLLKSAYSLFYEKMLAIFETKEIIRIFFDLSERQYTANQIIFEQNTRALTVFYMKKGSVTLRIKQGPKIFNIYSTLSQSQLIGHYEVLSNQQWPVNAITQRSSLIYSIERRLIMSEVNRNLILRERIKLIEYQLIHKNNCRMILHSCYFCHESHNFKLCPIKFPSYTPKIASISTGDSGAQPRKFRHKKNCLKSLGELQGIYKLHQNQNFKLIMKIEKRLGKIKRKVEGRSRVFEIDTAFDWKIYEPQWNLSELKEVWNQNAQKNIQIAKKNL